MAKTFDTAPDTPAVADTALETSDEILKKTPEQQVEEIRELREDMGDFEMMFVQDTVDTRIVEGLRLKSTPDPGAGWQMKLPIGASIWVSQKRVEYKPDRGSGTYPTTYAEVVYRDPKTGDVSRGWAAMEITGASGEPEVYLAPDKM